MKSPLHRSLVFALVIAGITTYLCARVPCLTYPFIGYVEYAGNIEKAGAVVHPVIARIHSIDQPLIWPIAHRGEKSIGPDNSMQNVKELVREKLPIIEIDLRWNSSGDIFLYHDAHLKDYHLLDGAKFAGRKAANLSSQELDSLTLLNGEKLPRLREVLQVVKGSDSVLALDLKSRSRSFVDKIVAEVLASGAEQHVILQAYDSFNPTMFANMLPYMRTNNPKIAVAARANHPEQIARLLRYSPELIQVGYEWFNKSIADQIHNAGSRVAVKLLDDMDNENTWQQVIDLGADLIVTDRATKFMKEFRPISLEASREADSANGKLTRSYLLLDKNQSVMLKAAEVF